MKFIKSFSNFGKINEDALPSFSELIAKWNKDYSSYFKFQNDKFEIPNGLEVTEVPGKNGAKYNVIALQGLDKLAELLIANPTAEVAVNAHTSSPEPSAGYNDKLSQQRADAIKAYLVNKGVKQNISAIGQGFKHPLEPNDKDDANKQLLNRRAEITITKEPVIVKKAEEVDSKFKDVSISLNMGMPTSSGHSNQSIAQYYGVNTTLDKNNPKFQEIKGLIIRAIQASMKGMDVKSPGIAGIAKRIISKEVTLDEVSKAIDNGQIKLIP